MENENYQSTDCCQITDCKNKASDTVSVNWGFEEGLIVLEEDERWLHLCDYHLNQVQRGKPQRKHISFD